MSSSEDPTSSKGEEGDTLALATMIPYSSDGPTLPVLGSSREQGINAMNAAMAGPATSAGASYTLPVTSDPKNHSELRTTCSASSTKSQVHSAPKIDLGPLQEPWKLLPPELLKAVEVRLGGEHLLEQSCVPVVFTKNQNIQSGINRLKAYLGHQQTPNFTSGIENKLLKENLVIAVSAQGEATTKLVGILEMVKRIVAPLQGDSKQIEKIGEWHQYTALSSRRIEKQTKKGPDQHRGDTGTQGEANNGEDEDCFEARRTMQEDAKFRTIPVLTTWLSKESIPELKDAYGELVFRVRLAPESG